jgi:hypothetical protein
MILKTPRSASQKSTVTARNLTASFARASQQNSMMAATPVSVRAVLGKRTTDDADEIRIARQRLDDWISKEVRFQSFYSVIVT